MNTDSFAITEKLELPVEITFCTNPSTYRTWFLVGIGIKTDKTFLCFLCSCDDIKISTFQT